MALLESSIDPTGNPKSGLLNGAGNEFSSTSDFDDLNQRPQNIPPQHNEDEDEEEEENDDEEEVHEIGQNDMNLAMHPWPNGYLATDGINNGGQPSRTMPSGPSRTSRQMTTETPSQLGTDHLGNTMSYEPEIDVDFLAIPNTQNTNQLDEGLEVLSDGQLYAPQVRSVHGKFGSKKFHIRTNSGKWKRNNKQNAVHYGYDRDDSFEDQHENKFQYSPFSDHGDSDPGYFNSSRHNEDIVTRHDHITQIGADEYAEAPPLDMLLALQ